MAKVAGITKTNTSVFPEKRGEGYCARLDTRMESVKAVSYTHLDVYKRQEQRNLLNAMENLR